MILKKLKSNWIVFFFIVLILLCTIVNLVFTKPIIYDQMIATYRFEYMPALSSGVATHYLIGIYNGLIHPPPAVQNHHIKLFAMLLFMISAFLLARSVLKNNLLTALFLLLIVLSRYPFLWLSTELITASLLFFSIRVIINPVSGPTINPAINALVLALMCFSKPEMVLVAVAFLIYHSWQMKKSGRSIKMFLTVFFVVSFLLLAPGILTQGKSYFSGKNRSLFSFGQHYSSLVKKHQYSQSTPDPWLDYNQYLESNFKGAKSIFQVWTQYPHKYIDFVMLSIGHGIIKCIQLFHVLLILLPGMLIFYFKKKVKLEKVEKLILLSFIGTVPFVLFAFPHIRYLARYYPLVIIFILLFLKRLLESGEQGKPAYKYTRYITIALIVVAIFINCYLFAGNLAQADTLKEFWFPD